MFQFLMPILDSLMAQLHIFLGVKIHQLHKTDFPICLQYYRNVQAHHHSHSLSNIS